MEIGNKYKTRQAGFTIIELLIATAVFSVVLLVVTTGIVRLGQTYYKGITQSRTQEAARSVAEEISREFQLVRGKKVDGNPNQFCVGDTTRYTYALDQMVGPGTYALLVQTKQPTDPCAASVDLNTSREMLGENMRLLQFAVTPNASSDTWRVQIKVAYGADDLLSHYADNSTPGNRIPQGWNGTDTSDPDVADATCKPKNQGGAFCATAQLDTLVKKRLNSQ